MKQHEILMQGSEFLRGVMASQVFNLPFKHEFLGNHYKQTIKNYFERIIEVLKEFSNIDETYLQTIGEGATTVMREFAAIEQQYIQTLSNPQLASSYGNSISSRLDNVTGNIIPPQLFSLELFSSLHFLRTNIVGIGANGAGKSSLINKLKVMSLRNFVVISAQKTLVVPTYNTVPSMKIVKEKRYNSQDYSKDFKTEYNPERSYYTAAQETVQEFNEILKMLLAENNFVNYEFAQQIKANKDGVEPPLSALDKCIDVWNQLITHRQLYCEGGTNLALRDLVLGTTYGPNAMSDGEKVILYNIALVLMAQDNSFIFVDEPEMYLHKSITNILWNKLETLRPDCKFVYFTHDLDFATNKVDATKVWVKEFSYPDKWSIEAIPDNEIPDSLMLEILGSRRDILFCESEESKMDHEIYSILFPRLHVIPVRGCSNVINYTKKHKDTPGVLNKAYGIIDADFRKVEQLNALKLHNVYALNVAELENLFLVPEFLQIFASNPIITVVDPVQKIVDEVLNRLIQRIKSQATTYVATKMNYTLNEVNRLDFSAWEELDEEFNKIKESIDVEQWYLDRVAELNTIVENKDYLKAIRVFNYKDGLIKIAKDVFKVDDYRMAAFAIVKSDPIAQEALKKYLPEELMKIEA